METNTATFTIGELPGLTFTVTRGSGGETGLPSNWISIVAADDDGNPTGFHVGFQGP